MNVAIKTIYRGQPDKKPEVWKGKCGGCKSVHECDKEDLAVVYGHPGSVERFGELSCPVCHEVCTFRPKSDYDKLKGKK